MGMDVGGCDGRFGNNQLCTLGYVVQSVHGQYAFFVNQGINFMYVVMGGMVLYPKQIFKNEINEKTDCDFLNVNSSLLDFWTVSERCLPLWEPYILRTSYNHFSIKPWFLSQSSFRSYFLVLDIIDMHWLVLRLSWLVLPWPSRLVSSDPAKHPPARTWTRIGTLCSKSSKSSSAKREKPIITL